MVVYRSLVHQRWLVRTKTCPYCQSAWTQNLDIAPAGSGERARVVLPPAAAAFLDQRAASINMRLLTEIMSFEEQKVMGNEEPDEIYGDEWK